MIDYYLHNVKGLISMAILLVLLAASITFCMPATAISNDMPQSTKKINEEHLIGRWIRPDGGYVLEIKEIGKDGVLKAAYFNPQPINVSRAELRLDKDTITIFVELRDVNYPGSTYNLLYDPKKDRLVGTYFQAVESVTYDIEFIRTQ